MATNSSDPSQQANPDSTGAGSGVDPNAVGQNGTNPNTGFASQYAYAPLNANIWDNPYSILGDVFKNINQTGGGYQALRDFGADPLTLYNIMQGQGNNLAGTQGGNAASNYTNWLASLYSSLGSVGGRGFNGAELLNSLFNPGSTGGSSALTNTLTAGDSSTQMRTLFNMAKAAAGVGLNPVAASGYEAALQRAGDTALNMQNKTASGTGANNVPMYQLIKQIAPGLVPGY